MTTSAGQSVPLADHDLGLDRTRIDEAGKIELVAESPEAVRPDKSDSGVNEVVDHGANVSHDTATQMGKRERFSIKAKKVLHIGSDENAKNTASAPVLADATETESDARLVHDMPEPEKRTLKDVVHNPVDTVKSKVSGEGGQQIAANLVAKEISHGQEVELVRAQDQVLQAKTEAARLLAIQDVDALKTARQGQFVRWTMDRHVTKVRILPRNTIRPKKRSDFRVISQDGRQKTDWSNYFDHLLKYYADQYGSEYIGYTSDPPSPTKQALMSSVERVAVASAPLQSLTMTIRRVYRWENRNETLKYLLGYVVLWTCNMILPGCLFAIIYLIIHRKVHAPTIEDLRKDIIRTEDVNQTALTLSEFIEKKGEQTWVDPLIEELGPWALVQLADVANAMEVIRNFYEWRVPSRTATTVAILSVGFIVVTFTPVWLLARATTLIIGIMFFGLFPIGSNLPDYRLLASPTRWLFWKVPTHAEWSVKSLQAEAVRHKRGTQSATKPVDIKAENGHPDPLGYRGEPTDKDGKAPESDPPENRLAEHRLAENKDNGAADYGSYICKDGGHMGRLILNSAGVRFQSAISHKQHWSLAYEEIQRMEKITREVQRKITKESGEDIKLGGPDGKEYLLLNMAERDQAFSQIVGFSPVTWQVVW